MTVDRLTTAPGGPTPCPDCGHWVGGPRTERPFDCPTCGGFFPVTRGGRDA